ncbi:MAG: molecular chaperone DnaJ [Clostridia bacterium]|nr:molecular chaperone DnaJ [Clostridia bacterium]
MADAKKRDYYEVLGVARDATPDQIKKAFHIKAKECHPDTHPGDKAAEAKFKELNEANEVLSDPDKRARYDQFGFEDPTQGMGGGNPFEGGFGFGVDDILNSFFGGGMGGMGGMGGTRRSAGPVQGSHLRYELRISFEEAADGCKKSFEFYRSENCDQCGGSGAKPGTSPVTCTTCRGAGQIRTGSGWVTMMRTCPTCQGTGKMIQEKCPGCGGSGRKRVRRTASVNIPAGIDNGQTIVVNGGGEPGLRGGPSGDLYVTVLVRPHKLFKREDTDLLLDFPISFTQAALGAELDVPTLHGTVKYKIPEGTQTGTEFRIKGKGIPVLGGRGQGDLILTVHVDVPKRLSEKQKDLLRQFEASATGREYEGRRTFMDKLKSVFGGDN